jgi:hypothetical protein
LLVGKGVTTQAPSNNNNSNISSKKKTQETQSQKNLLFSTLNDRKQIF